MIPNLAAMLLVPAFLPVIDDQRAARTTEDALKFGHINEATFDGVCDPKTMAGHGVAGA